MHDLRTFCSRAALILALALLAGSFFLISPRPGQTYPGAIPWSDLSILRPITELMSLGGALATVRGVEIKDIAFHAIAAAGLLLLGIRQLAANADSTHSTAGRVAAHAQVFLALWVFVSLLSSLWSGAPDLARGGVAIYALSVGWAVALAQTFHRRDLTKLLYGIIAISALGAALCVWYYHERNPHHRPGFPLGNPSLLAAALVPGVLCTVCILGAAASESRRANRLVVRGPVLGAFVALVPLVWCLALTNSRGALLALAFGLGVIVMFQVARWLRWVLATVCTLGVLSAGMWLFYTSHLDVTMARGATMRFRVYAWRYAAAFWQDQPLHGHGVGAYPRLAGQLAVRDRTLDPAAFMAELVEHAHNELFEILAEIGLVGGVTYVAGLLATGVAAVMLLRSVRAGPQRWLALALVASVAALLVDMMVGVAVRLPGGAAVFYTLLGALWAVCRTTTAVGTFHVERTATALNPRVFATALICVAAAGSTTWLTVRNGQGVVQEAAGRTAFQNRDYGVALAKFERASPRLLDPVRKVIAREFALNCRLRQAEAAVGEWQQCRQSATTQPAAEEPCQQLAQRARDLAQMTFADATKVRAELPSLEQSDAVAARAARWLAVLSAERDVETARQWRQQSELAWRRQRTRTPFDVETLLALRDHPGRLADHIALLRDSLRFGDAQGPWLKSLAALSRRDRFEQTLAAFVAAVGPITPQTDLDSLIASMASETYRLAAAWRLLQGEPAQAAQLAAQAAWLYEPMRSRFPIQQSVALAEQAYYTFLASPATPQSAIALAEEAIARLPQIQPQKYEARARPFRMRLTQYLLAAGKTDAAVRTLRQALGESGQDPDLVSQFLRRLITDAAQDGVPAEMVERIEATLCPDFPAFCEPEPQNGPQPE